MRVIFVLFFVVGVAFAFCTAADEAVAPEPQLEVSPNAIDADSSGAGEHADPDDIPPPNEEESFEPVDPAVVADVLRFCKEIRYRYHPVIALKQERHPESALFRSAHDLGVYLDDARTERMKKPHHHFTCDEGLQIVRHSLAQTFVENFKRYVEGGVEPNITLAETAGLLADLRTELEQSGFINDEVLAEVDSIRKDLSHIGDWQRTITAAYTAVLASPEGVDCAPAYRDFYHALEQMSTQHMPNWEHIDSGLLHLIMQCAEDPYLKDELLNGTDEATAGA